MRVLVVEDTPALARAIATGLGEEGLAVDVATNGEDGLHLAAEVAYDLVILDRMLPVVDGLEVLRGMRARGRDTPVLLLTALGAVGDRVEGLNAGADDYLVKPFAFDELLARARALIRRGHGRAANVVEIGELRIDLGARSASVRGRPLTLTARELGVLELLALTPGRTLSRTALTERMYADDGERDSNVIDVFVARLRRKLAAAGLPDAIETRRGEGYRLTLAAPNSPIAKASPSEAEPGRSVSEPSDAAISKRPIGVPEDA